MNEIPDAVKSAFSGREPYRPIFDEAAVLARGDLRVVAPLEDSAVDCRLCVVLRIHEADGFAEVMLAHSAPELATSWDAIIPAAAVGTPYGIVAQTDLRFAVEMSQLGRRVGHLSEQLIVAVQTSVDSAGDQSAVNQALRVGTPLKGPADRRWQFKKTEGVAVSALQIWPE